MVAKAKVNIADVAKRTQRKIETAAHEVAQDLAEEVVDRTPVITGNLQGHWFQGLNGNRDVPGGLSEDKSGSQTVGRISAAINEAEIGDTIGVYNGASYAKFVENGTSKLRPRSFVSSTVNDAPQIAEQTILRIAKT